ncbi:hypothetical protein DSO57_1023758 [Entomophthora muscae]|uniref:Uncharacterized protein n=1 Tax=Entomophthora muscae TaxID=34485 RepID=A0ACC2TR50_9FUNG|nr:hypothetical protein DSO57_1023758 [Entomophthora muscae]
MIPVPILHPFSSPSPIGCTQTNPNAPESTPTDVMKHHLQEIDPESTPNQMRPGKENAQANAAPTSPEVSNYFIGLKGEEKLLSQGYPPADDNPSAHKQVQTAKQPQPQMIVPGKNSHQSASSNPTDLKVKPEEPNQVPSAVPSHESASQSNDSNAMDLPSPTQPKILGTLSPVLKNSSSSPKVPVTKGWITRVHQGATSCHFQGRPDEWYKTHLPTIKSDTDNV